MLKKTLAALATVSLLLALTAPVSFASSWSITNSRSNEAPIGAPAKSSDAFWPNPELFSSKYYLTVDLTNQVVTAYSKDEFGNYSKMERQMICSAGEDVTPTPTGTFHITRRRNRWHYFRKFNVWAQYMTQFNGEYLFHSILYSRRDEKTINRTSVRKLGEPASHGCIRLTPEDAKWIYDNCLEGTPTEVFYGEKNAELTKLLKDAVNIL